MKAIVAEIDKKHMIVITDKGDFVRIRRQMSAAIGDEIEYTAPVRNLSYKRLAPIAACFLAFTLLSTGVYAYYTPYSYVSVDINPSIAMSLNRFERVIAVEAITDDAADFIKNTKALKNNQVDKALSTIIKSASEKGYIDEKEENQVMIVVSAEDPRQKDKLAGKLDKTALEELAKVNHSSGATVEKTGIESFKAAVANKQSPGMEILSDKLKKVNPGIKDEEIRNMSVNEAFRYIREGKKNAKGIGEDGKNKPADSRNELMEDLKSKKHRNWKGETKASETGAEDKKGKKDQKNQASDKPTDKGKAEAPKNSLNEKPGIQKENGKAPGGHKPEGWYGKPGRSGEAGPDRNRDKDKEKLEAGGQEKGRETAPGENKQKEKDNGKGGTKDQKSRNLKGLYDKVIKKLHK